MAATITDPNERKESPLPTVNERLGHLKPSRELLEYYRRKIAEYDGEYDEMARKLELYKCTYEEQVSLMFFVLTVNRELATLYFVAAILIYVIEFKEFSLPKF